MQALHTLSSFWFWSNTNTPVKIVGNYFAFANILSKWQIEQWLKGENA
jgi:hypothetical protein